MRLSSKVLIAVIVLTLTLLALKGWKESLREEGRQEVREQLREQSEQQTARMRDMLRAGELRYTVQAETRDRYIVQTVKEIHEAAAPLADCRLPADVRVRLNAAGACARGDSAAACGPDDAVPGPR